MSQPTNIPASRLEVGRLDVALSIFVLFNLAVSQPILDLLGKNPTFFIVRRSPRFDIVLLLLGLTLLGPLAVWLVVAAAGSVNRRARTVAHVLAIGGLGFLLGLQIALHLPKIRSAPGLVVAGVALVLAVGGVLLYYRAHPARTVVRAAALLPILLAVIFLFASPVSKILFGSPGEGSTTARVQKPANVAMVVFDEFAITSLMDAQRNIDAGMYPNFAALVRDATWYRNATTVHDFTDKAVPAILTGRFTKRGQLPNAQDHPDNLFTLLSATHTEHATEPLTQLCPPRACKSGSGERFVRRWRGLLSDVEVIYEHLALPPDFRRNTPRIDQAWGHFRAASTPVAAKTGRGVFGGRTVGESDPKAEFDAFVRAIEPTSDPRLDFVHVLLPHAPWRYLPNGQSYRIPKPSIFVQHEKVWDGDPWLTASSEQRYLLQVAFADHLIGQLVAKLKSTGLYDQTLLVITADHGVSFQAGKAYRHIERDTLGEIAHMPLFIKLPGQARGEVSDRPVQTIDILPTMADALDAAGLWKTDGRSLLDPNAPELTRKVIFNQSLRPLYFGANGEEMMQWVAKKLELFGSSGDASRVYSLVPPGGAGLLGKPAAANGTAGFGASVEGLESYGKYNPDAGSIHSFVTGFLDSASQRRHVLALAVNGTIRAVTRSFDLNGARFAAMVPPDVFRKGRNTIELFLVDGGTLRRVALRAS